MARTNLTKEIVSVASPLDWGRSASKDGQIDYLQAGIVDPSIMKRARAKGHTSSQLFQTETLDLQVPPKVSIVINNSKR